MPWRFKLHVNDVVNDTLIQHDVVYLQHTEKYSCCYVVGVFCQPQDKILFSRNSKKRQAIN